MKVRPRPSDAVAVLLASVATISIGVFIAADVSSLVVLWLLRMLGL